MEENDYKLIDEYLQGELTDDRQPAFKERLKNDKEFAKALKMSEEMTNYLKASQKKPALEAKMIDLGKQYFKAEQSTKAKVIKMPFWKMGMAIAAALALLMIVWNPFDSSDLYTQYVSHPSLALVEKSAMPEMFQQAEKAYADGAYEKAFTALSEVVKADPENVQAQLALGISALETGRMKEAQSMFNELANGASSFKSYGQWYLALSYIKQGENEKAKPVLKAMDNSEPALKAKATELLLLLLEK